MTKRLCILFVSGFLFTRSVVAQQKSVVAISPGESIQEAVNRYPEGTTFRIKTGIHRLQTIVPKNGDKFMGEPGAVLSGARLLSSFSREGPYYVASGQTQEGPKGYGTGTTYGRKSEYQEAKYPEDLYIDDRPLKQVGSKDLITSGEFFFDYPRDKIFFLDDPTGKKVETSVIPMAFHCGKNVGCRDVTIQNLVIEKYACPAQHGAIHARSGYNGTLSENWTVADCEIRLNHGSGIRFGNNMKVLRNKLLTNGNFGFEGNGSGILCDGNEVAYNNYAGYEMGWGAGGVKFSRTDRVTVRNNFFHDNLGNGLWTDGFNTKTLFENNVVVNNLRNGIVHEVAHDAIIRNNVCKGNGREANNWFWGAQILVMNGSPVEIFGNRVEVLPKEGNGISLVQQNRDPGTTFEITKVKPNRIHVHHNDITFLGDKGVVAAGSDHFGEEFLASLRIDFNTYHLPDLNKTHWALNQFKTWDQLQGLGHEVHGTRDTNVPAKGNPSPIVWAGPDLEGQGASPVKLRGIASDESETPTVQWTKRSGPGTVTFSNAKAEDSASVFGSPGTYVLRLTASDGVSTDYDEMKVTVPTGTVE